MYSALAKFFYIKMYIYISQYLHICRTIGRHRMLESNVKCSVIFLLTIIAALAGLPATSARVIVTT